MNEGEIRGKLFDKLDNNLDDFLIKWESMDSSELIGKAEEISATKMTYDTIKNGRYNAEFLGHLLKYENPLEVVRDQSLANHKAYFMQNLDSALQRTLIDNQNVETSYGLDKEYAKGEPAQGMEMQ